MELRKFIEEVRGRILPGFRFASAPGASSGAAHGTGSRAAGRSAYIAGVGADGSAQAIRRYLTSRRNFTAPPDLNVAFLERDGVVVLFGTAPREAEERERLLEAARNIQGVERVDDRMSPPAAPANGAAR